MDSSHFVLIDTKEVETKVVKEGCVVSFPSTFFELSYLAVLPFSDLVSFN